MFATLLLLPSTFPMAGQEGSPQSPLLAENCIQGTGKKFDLFLVLT